jgi:hypothetical protein
VHHQLETSQGEINAQNLIHELAGQNEMLVQSLAKMQTVLRQYTELYDFAPIGYFTLSRNGMILQVNLNFNRSGLGFTAQPFDSAGFGYNFSGHVIRISI